MKQPIHHGNEKFSQNLTTALRHATEHAATIKQKLIEPIHLLLALAENRGSIAAELLTETKLDIPGLTTIIKEATLTGRGKPQLSNRSQSRLMAAALVAYQSTHPYIGTEHMLFAILEDPGPEIERYKLRFPWDTTALKDQLDMILKSNAKLPELTETFIDVAEEPADSSGDDLPAALKGFGIDLTDVEHAKTLDPVIGRDQEIERLMQVLVRRTKNNPVLLGDPGVGKTAIVEGLAKRISEGKVPAQLRGKRIVALDIGSLVAGTMFRGEFENRIRQVIEELKRSRDLIVFIDELHTIVGAGAASGSIDAANLLKPALARGDIRCIGATTMQEYRQHIETDGALERRFQPIHVDEPSAAATRNILEGLKSNYEKHHGVRISDAALDAAVRYADRYLPDRFFPDKAIDLIDEAAARISLAARPSAEAERHYELMQAERLAVKRKEAATIREKFEEAIHWREEARRHHERRQELERLLVSQEETKPIVDERAVAAVITNWTRIPVNEVTLNEQHRLKRLEQDLAQNFFGHDDVRKTIAETIRRTSLGLSNRKRPLASFLLSGPSGVGKTTLAKTIAKVLFGDEAALLHFDMSEFAEGFTVSKLIGAPAGYVGYKESGILTEEVRRRPYRVILFDELNRAHKDVNQLLLQILDEGALRDATGRLVNFKQTILIATVNPSPQGKTNLGFGNGGADSNRMLQDEILEATKQLLPAELLHRFDTILPLLPLTEENMTAILNREIINLNERLRDHGATIEVSTKARKELMNMAAKQEGGARALLAIFRSIVEGELAKKIVSRPVNTPRTYTMDRQGRHWILQ
ncbi:MAG: ATP-dependent Clp protease ATP-binding subunit [Patescibacteria group bacterium]|jgi:ATP-dependent Clp protease ATP-binding subunit ClpC